MATSAPARGSDPPDEPDQEQKNHGAERGGDDIPPDRAAADLDVELVDQEPAADIGADDADDDVADDAETGSLDDLGGEPACDEADQENDNQTMRVEYVDTPHAASRPRVDCAGRLRAPQ